MTESKSPIPVAPGVAKYLSMLACVLTFASLLFDFGDWGSGNAHGFGVIPGWEMMLILGTWFFTYGGFVFIFAHFLTVGTLLEVTGRHVRKSPHWGYCILQWMVAVLSIVLIEQPAMKLDGSYALRAWEGGQLCSAGAATVYSCSISRQLRNSFCLTAFSNVNSRS